MKALLPWRVRKVVSDHFPLAYHLIANAGFSGNDAGHWDARLAETWDQRDWPTKFDRIRSLTKAVDTILDVGCGSGSILRRLGLRRQLPGLATLPALLVLIAAGAVVFTACTWVLNRTATVEALVLLFPRRFAHLGVATQPAP